MKAPMIVRFAAQYKIPLLLGLVCLSALLSTLPGIELTSSTAQPQQQSTTGSYIVQGAGRAVMNTAINRVGGKVTREFSVIKAVAAILSQPQIEQLRAELPQLRLFADNNVVSTAGTIQNSSSHEISANKALKWKPSQNSVHWTLKNKGETDLTIKSIFISWPSNNRKLVQTKTGSMVIQSDHRRPKFTTIIPQAPLALMAGQNLKLKFKFKDTPVEKQHKYSVSVAFNEGGQISFNTDNSSGAFEQPMMHDTHVATLTGASALHLQGITGSGIGVAVIDSGIFSHHNLNHNTNGVNRIQAFYNVFSGEDMRDADGSSLQDGYGHGSHIASVIASSGISPDAGGNDSGSFNGIAPDVDLTIIKAFDEQGKGTYSSVLSALEYVLAHQAELNIRVLNMSFSAAVQSYYWDDPINQAVMMVWNAGIVVVTSAGNHGPNAMTVGVPGNNPYVITVGAISDNYTPEVSGDDFLTDFSSTGPTYEGFLKPEIVTIGSHVEGHMNSEDHLPVTHPEFHDEINNRFSISGTSSAAAITTGVVALMLQQDPQLTPDTVKCRLMATAALALSSDQSLAYSIFQQGAGAIHAGRASNSSATGCFNSMDIQADIDNVHHYAGPAQQDANGHFYLADIDGFEWNGEYDSGVLADGVIWDGGLIGSDGVIWDGRFIDSDGVEGDGVIWDNTIIGSDGVIWDGIGDDGVIWDGDGVIWDGVENDGVIWD